MIVVLVIVVLGLLALGALLWAGGGKTVHAGLTHSYMLNVFAPYCP
jgi:hypothetical protein